MKIFVNNKEYNIEQGNTLSDLLTILEKSPEGIAFAINNKVVKKELWNETILEEGAKIILIKAVCGG